MVWGSNLGLIGIATYIFGLITYLAFGSLLGPFVMGVYLLSVLAFAGGMFAYSAFLTPQGHLKGFSWGQWLVILIWAVLLLWALYEIFL